MNAPVLSLWRGEMLLTLPAMSMRDIVRGVAEARGCSVAELLGQSRERIIVWPRQEAMWLCRQQRLSDGRKRYSLPTIGKYFGRDHTTVLHGVREHQKRLDKAARLDR